MLIVFGESGGSLLAHCWPLTVIDCHSNIWAPNADHWDFRLVTGQEYRPLLSTRRYCQPLCLSQVAEQSNKVCMLWARLDCAQRSLRSLTGIGIIVTAGQFEKQTPVRQTSRLVLRIWTLAGVSYRHLWQWQCDCDLAPIASIDVSDSIIIEQASNFDHYHLKMIGLLSLWISLCLSPDLCSDRNRLWHL